jgi:putative transcriptional regulator
MILNIMYIIMYIIREALKMEHKGVLENKLREFRFNRDQITQEELANALGVSRQTILAIEHGKFNPSVVLALRLARFFGARVEEIFILREEMK